MAKFQDPEPVILVDPDGNAYAASGGGANSSPSNVKITDGSVSPNATVKASSTAPEAADTAIVVAQSPNSPTPAGDSVIGRVKLTDGASVGTFKAGLTPSAAVDSALVVALSPNSPLPPGTNALGSVTVSSGTFTLGTGSNTIGTVNILDVPASGTPSINTIAVSTSSASLTASSSTRRGVFIYNAATTPLFIAFGASATTTAYTMQLAAGAVQFIGRDVYTGQISGILATGAGSVQLTVTN